MFDNEKIESLLHNLKVEPKTIKAAEVLLLNSRLKDAIELLKKDRSFMVYLLTIMRKANFNVNINDKADIEVIANSLGKDVFMCILTSYSYFLKLPVKYEIFHVNTIKLAEINARLISFWVKILTSINKKTIQNLNLINVFIINIIICEHIFKGTDLREIISLCDTNYNKIFKKIYGKSMVALAFEMLGSDMNDQKIMSNLHMLISYEISRIGIYDYGFYRLFDLSSEVETQNLIEFKRFLTK
ncbi:MAG: hypothetical protein K5978_08350 [Campylobacter sp.]|nr:hypothetical protein [Campylobacter sp.]